MGLYESIKNKTNEYLKITDAMELVAKEEGSLFKAATVLSHYKLGDELICYFMTGDYSIISENSFYEPFDEGASCVWEVLESERSNQWLDPDNLVVDSQITEKYKNFYWKRSDFFKSEPIIILGISDGIEKSELNSDNLPTSIEYYKFLLFKKPLLSIHEAACIISSDDPNTVDRCQNDTNFDQNFNDYLHAFSLVESAVMAETLPKEDMQFYGIKNTDLKKYLVSENIFIDGFNDNLSPQNQSNFGTPVVQQTEPNIENLNAEITQLRELVAEKDVEIEKLKEQIRQLQDDQLSDQSEKPGLLDLIFDETVQGRYAPDLVYAIKAWESIYINNPKTDSHNNKANTWIKNNTPYTGEQEDSSTRRLREIISPLSEWRDTRKKLLNDE